MRGCGNAVSFFVIVIADYGVCVYLWKCCYLYISPDHFLARGASVESCVGQCSAADKFTAIGDITLERAASGMVKNFSCHCLPDLEQCIEMPRAYCFSRLDRNDWMPTGGPPLSYSIYTKCMQEYYGEYCNKPCLCRSLCAPISGKCPQKDCLNKDEVEFSDDTCRLDCEKLSYQCKLFCTNNTSIVECKCNPFEFFDIETRECKGYAACAIHKCSPVACRTTTDQGDVCDCSKEPGTYQTLVYGLPFCRRLVAPCEDHICEGNNTECHEDLKGRAVCFCEGGNLPDYEGSCVNPSTLPTETVLCHGHFNQGYYTKCLCHDNFVSMSTVKCERDVATLQKNLPCMNLTQIHDNYFCRCPPSCDRLKLCNGTDTCRLPAECKKCQITHNNLLLNHTFGGALYVTNHTNVFVVLGPSEFDGDAANFSYKGRGDWVYFTGRLVNFTSTVTSTPTPSDYFQFRIEMNESTFLSYPIYLAPISRLSYRYEFADGFFQILDESFGTYPVRVNWNMNGTVEILWYCTRMMDPQYMKFINLYPCYKDPHIFHERGMTLTFDESKLLLDEGSTYTEYYVYAVPLYRHSYMPEIVKRITVKKRSDKSAFRMTCERNCGPSLDTLDELKLVVEADITVTPASHSYKWKLPPGEVEGAVLDQNILKLDAKQIRRLEDGSITFVVIVFNKATRMSFHLVREFNKTRLARKNCAINPTHGFGLVTRFTATCERNFSVKIMSGLCGKRKDVTLLKFKGTTDRPIENLVFSIGDPNDYYHKCIYVIDSQLVDDVDSIKFMVIKNLTYVTNFQYLGNLRMDSLSTIIVIGNAIEFFNDNPATDELDIDYRVKCRELLLDLILLNWNKLEDHLLQMETIKLIYLLLGNPLEIDPMYVVNNMKIYEMIDASKLWTTDNFNLTDEEHSTSLVYLTESLSYILYSAYVRYNESHDIRSKRVLSYVLDNLAYLGNYYVNQVTKNKTKTIATSVFTLYLQKFDLRANETMELSVDDGDSQFRIKIPTTPSLKMLDTEVTMKLVIFPFNPLALTTGSLFTPTVSVSLYAEETYLPLKNLLSPVEIIVPTETSEWLTYPGRFGTGTSVTNLNLPTTLFNNTLYKLKINIKFVQVQEELRRINGVLVMILCEGSIAEIEARTKSSNYIRCHEIAFKRINFYRKAEKTFNFTLPPMFMQYTQTKLIYSFLTNDKVEYTLTFSMIQLSCQYWYDPDEKSSYGCAVSPIHTTDEKLVCLCYHLSMFSGDINTDASNLDITSIFGESIHESVSQIGIAMVTFLWIFFIIFGIWAKKMDQKLAILAYPVDLADNYPNAEYVYLVAVETGLRPFAGCDGTVFLVLIGTLNKSLSHKLVCKRYITLQTGHQNYFIIRTTEPLGKVTQVRLWIVDETQSNKKINWYVNIVTVFDLQFRDAYVFICDEWMGVNMKGVSNDMTFFAATSLMLNEFNNIFTMNFFKGFVENHVWFSIYTNPILSRFTRFQRVATCKLNTHLYLLTTLIFQQLQRPSARSGTIFYTIFKDVALTIIIGILMSPLFWFFDVLFSQSRKRKITHNIISDWNRNVGAKKKEDEPEEELALTRFMDVIINFMSKICKGPAGAEVQEEAEFEMYEENPNLGTTGLAFNQFQQMIETGSIQNNLSNNKIRVFPTFQRNYNAKPKSERGSLYSSKQLRNSRISHIDSLDSFSTEYDKESAKESVHTVSDIAKGLLQEEIIGEKTKLLMKTLIEQRGGKLKKKMRKYHVETVEGHLPWWMNLVAWIFLTITICVTSFSIFVLSKQNVADINADWFLRVFITLLANIFVIDPICIVVGAFCRSLVSRQYINFPLGRLGVIKREALLNLTHYYDYHKRRVYKLRKSPFYKSPIMIKKKIKVEKKMKLSKLLLLNILLFTYLVACAMIISMSMYDYSMFLAKYSVERLLIGRHIKEIKERDHYFHWLRNHLIPNIYSPEANQAVMSKMFSRSLNFQSIPSVTAYAINYPCFTRLGDAKTWAAYHDDPEWYEFETICMGYSRGLGAGCIDVMENNSFFNFNFVAMGTTFYIYIPAVQSVAWIFIAAHQPLGGGFRVAIEEIFLVSHSPIPFEQPRVAIALIMFWPAFGFSLFRNMKRFFYVGAGRYFSNFWNILDLAMTFMVLMISIIYTFVIHGISDVFSEFYLATGDLYVTFYISGVVGILFLIHLMTFSIVIRVVELLKLNHMQRIFQLCLAQALKIFCLIAIKFSCIAMGLIYLKMSFFSEHKEEYAQINQRFVFFIYDIVHTRKVLGMDANYHTTSVVVLIISIFSGIVRALVVSDIVLTYRRLRRYQSHNKDMKNLMEYLKTLMLDFFKWSGATLSGKRPPKKHHKKKGMFYRPFAGRKDSSDIEMKSMQSSFVKPVEL